MSNSKTLAICSIEGCSTRVECRALCSKHYQRLRKSGTVEYNPPTTEERFWSKVRKGGYIPTHRPELGPCWQWIGYLGPAGYGRFDLPSRPVLAHRFSLALLQSLDQALHVDHVCRNTACVRPSHLEQVTPAENIARSLPFRSKPKRCPQGHDYEELGYRNRSGSYECKVCRGAEQRARRRRKAAS